MVLVKAVCLWQIVVFKLAVAKSLQR